MSLIIIIIIILAAILGHRGMQAGVYPVLNRCFMATAAIAAAVAFAGPLQLLIPWGNPYLNSACLLAIALAAYGLQRAIAELHLPERGITLPEHIDRLGGALAGFLGGLVVLSFFTLVLLKLPPDTWSPSLSQGLEQAAQVAIRAVRLVGLVAGTDELILLKNIAP